MQPSCHCRAECGNFAEPAKGSTGWPRAARPDKDALSAACGQACRNTLDENIRALLEGHPATTGDLPVQQVLNVDLLDVAVIGDPIVPAFAPDPSAKAASVPLASPATACSAAMWPARRLRGRSRPRRPDDRRGLGRQPPPPPRQRLGPPAAAPAANRRTTAVKLANISARAALVLGARSPTSPSCPAAGSAPSS